MKNFILVLVLAVVGLALPHPSQAAGPLVGIPGYYDTTTSTFVPIVTAKVLPATAPVTRTGTVKVVITLSIEAGIGTDEPITCNSTVSEFDASFNNSASAGGLVTRTGSKGTLTMTIPYNWTIAAATETATVSLNCMVGNSFSVGAIGHSFSITEASFTVPPNGTVTTKTISGSL